MYTVNKSKWVKYECQWTGKETGAEKLRLYDYYGLPAGDWQLTITVNGEVLLNEQFVIQGQKPQSLKSNPDRDTCYDPQ